VKILEFSKDRHPTIDRGKIGAAGYDAKFRQLPVCQKDSSGKEQLASLAGD
jgi:hypothetical protein